MNEFHSSRRGPGKPDHATSSNLTVFFRARFIAVAATLLLITAMVALSIALTGVNEDRHNRILNSLGRQRMLTQMIAKDANRVSTLIDAIGSGDRLQEVSVLAAKLEETRADLRAAALAYNAKLDAISAGYVPFDDVSGQGSIELFDLDDPGFAKTMGEIRALWGRFYPSAEAVASRDSKDTEFREALIFVNENNIALLDLSDRLTSIALDRFSRDSGRTELLFGALIAGFIVLSGWLLYGTYVFLIEPYTVFYRGIRTMGAFDGSGPPAPRSRYSALTKEVSKAFDMLRDLVSLVGTISQGSSFSQTLSLIFKTFRSYVPYEYIGVATFVGYRGTRLVASWGESDGSFPGLPERLKDRAYDIGITTLGPILESGHPRIINDLEAYAAGRPPREYTEILLEAGIRSSITLPLTVNGKALGFLFFSSRVKEAYNDLHVGFLRNIRNAIGLAFEKDIFVDELVYGSTLALAKMAEARDEDTADHLDRMREYTVLLAKLLVADGARCAAVDGEFLHEIERFSPMHDIGKVGIRDGVLLKPAKLDPAEWEHMKTHTTYGADVLREAENNVSRGGKTLFGMGIRIAEGHHERWDGSGYPKGLSGEAIPLEARIVSVADVLDALTTRRPYKEPFGFEESVGIMREGAGSHFDPEIFRVFEENVDSFRAMFEEFRLATPETF